MTIPASSSDTDLSTRTSPNPHKRRFGEERVVGKVKHRCRDQVDSFHVTMQLQRDTEDGWQDMGKPEVDRRIPNVGEKHETIVVFPDCVTGTWRSKVNVVMHETRVSDRFEIGESYSVPQHIKCET